jgi:type IV pilus assembly protein PilV
MNSTRRFFRRRRARRGLTLIEMIIAIIVMSIGIMGLAGTATYVAKQMGEGSTQTVAATLAAKLADSLASRRCSAIVAGNQTKRRVTLTWTVEDSSRTKWIKAQVQYPTKRGTRTLNYVTVVQCPD